jgi:hypothetical protein
MPIKQLQYHQNHILLLVVDLQILLNPLDSAMSETALAACGEGIARERLHHNIE